MKRKEHLKSRTTSTEFVPILALTIMDEIKQKILIAVRSRETNPTHPDVASVPTGRIPTALYDDLIQGAGEGYPVQDFVQTSKEYGVDIYPNSQFVNNQEASAHNSVIHSVESLMTKKLGLAEALEKNMIEFKARARLVLHGNAHYPNLFQDGIDHKEEIDMLNIEVLVKEGADLFPSKTASYRDIVWASLEEFTQMTQNKDVCHLGLNGFQTCVDGLCVPQRNLFSSKINKNTFPPSLSPHPRPEISPTFDEFYSFLKFVLANGFIQRFPIRDISRKILFKHW